MKRADWLTFIAAIIIVMGIALVVNLPKITAPGPASNTSGNATAYVYDTCTDGSCCQPKPHYIYDFQPVTGVKTIRLNNDLNTIYALGAKGYPRISFPTGMKTSTGDVEPVDDNTNTLNSLPTNTPRTNARILLLHSITSSSGSGSTTAKRLSRTS